MKARLKTKDSEVNVYVDNEFYTSIKNWLLKQSSENVIRTWRTATMKRKGWKVRNDVVISNINKETVSFSQLYDALQEANMSVAHQRSNVTGLSICTIVF